MGIAALNIDGYKMNILFDFSPEIHEGSATSRRIKPWDTDCLQRCKQTYNADNISAIIIDEISMVEPWMLVYLHEHHKGGTKKYAEPIGCAVVIMLGDFDQQPSIGGSSLPHLTMEFQKKSVSTNITFYTNLSKQKALEIKAHCQGGETLFGNASHQNYLPTSLY